MVGDVQSSAAHAAGLLVQVSRVGGHLQVLGEHSSDVRNYVFRYVKCVNVLNGFYLLNVSGHFSSRHAPQREYVQLVDHSEDHDSAWFIVKLDEDNCIPFIFWLLTFFAAAGVSVKS